MARKQHGVSLRTWRYVHDLAEGLIWDPELHVPRIACETFPWHDAMEEQFVHMEVILDAPALEAKRDWDYSPGDEEADVELAKGMAELRHCLLVSFVVAIARSSQRIARAYCRGMRNTLQASLGNCRVIVAAYRSLASGRLTPSNIRLRLSGVTD